MKWRFKSTGWFTIGIIVIILAMLFYVLHRPITLKWHRLESSLLIICISPLILILLTGNLPFSDFMEKRLAKQAKWRRVIAQNSYAAFNFFLSIFLIVQTIAWISCQFADPQIMQAEIMGVQTSAKSCDKWTLKLANQAEVRVCQTGPSLEWQERQIIEVSVRESALAYEVSYYRH